jgi:N-acetylated-alpha-linked acidic dipeptidase
MHDAYISLPRQATLRLTQPHEQELPCITHSMGLSTPPGGVTAELVYAGKGSVEDYGRVRAAGQIALVEGFASEEHAANASRAGLKGLVCISGRHPHEMCCSTVWGSPSQRTLPELPSVHLLSVNRADGEKLRELCRHGNVAVHFTAAVETGWTKTPLVLADLPANHPAAERDKFVLFSGHLDSWHLGAMDNGSANAAMLEVGRLFAPYQRELRRGLRIAMWSGHSHGRYSSSAWYADNFWLDLRDHCVVHINIDSAGAIDADRFETPSMPETAGVAQWAVRKVTGAELISQRVGRNSDQSFLGIGIPSVLGAISFQNDGSLGWWWHTPYDTLDKIDPVRLSRDTKIAVLIVDRFLTDLVLPFDYAASAADLKSSLESLAQDAGGKFDLSRAIAAASKLQKQCTELNARVAQANDTQARLINSCLQSLGRMLIPATYTIAGLYAHDPALETEFLPRLKDTRKLASLQPDHADAKFLLVDLVRGRNAVVDALEKACHRVDRCLSDIGELAFEEGRTMS